MSGRGSEVGSLLRSTRLAAGLHLEALEVELRIKAANLLAIEEGRAKDLPGPAYALGFVRTYAIRLGLDADEIIRRFKAEHSTLPRTPELTLRAPVREGGVPSGVFVIVGIILALVIWGGWYLLDGKRDSVRAMVEDVPARFLALIQHQTPATPSSATVVIAPAPVVSSAATAGDAPAGATATATSSTTATTDAPATNVLASLPTLSSSASAPTLAATPSAPTSDAASSAAVSPPAVAAAASPPVVTPPTPPPDTTAAPAATTGSRVTLQGAGYAWIQVRDGKTVVTERVLRKGDSWAVPNRPGLILRTGNAGAVRIIIDGNPIALLGAPGEVRRAVPLDPDRLRASLKTTSSSSP